MNVAAYLKALDKELQRQGLAAGRFMEETRGHLADAVEAGRARGLSSEEAESEAVARYGDARALAAKLAAGKNRTLHWVLLGVGAGDRDVGPGVDAVTNIRADACDRC
jgi:hypothetical protein